MNGTLVRGIGSFYTVDVGGKQVTCRAQKKLRRTGAPLVGDQVRISLQEGSEEGWIEEILPRKNQLERPAVANVDLLLLVIAPLPQPDLLLVEKLILRARMAGILPAICVNKRDLGGDLAGEILRGYQDTGLEVFDACARTGEGTQALRSRMEGKLTCLAGQSAVGKSSLINRMFGTELETGGLSRKTDRGRHTTRRAELWDFGGTLVMDTPGFSLLETGLVDPDTLTDYFPEYRELGAQCRFQPCFHMSEPGCAVRRGVEKGQLGALHWQNYRRMAEEIRQTWRERYQ